MFLQTLPKISCEADVMLTTLVLKYVYVEHNQAEILLPGIFSCFVIFSDNITISQLAFLSQQSRRYIEASPLYIVRIVLFIDATPFSLQNTAGQAALSGSIGVAT